jgi:hypothetical protein
VISGAPGGAGDGKRWDLVFELMPWRVVGHDDEQELPLRVEIAVSEKELERWMDKLADQATVQVEVSRLTAKASYASGELAPWSLAIGRLPVRLVKGSRALQAARAMRQQPVVIRDAVLGKLVLDRAHSWFRTKLSMRGRRCALSICQSGGTEDRARDLRDIARARQVVARIDKQWLAIEKAIVRSKLRLYNEVWRDRGRVLRAKELLARIRLESIVVYGDATATLYFNAGRLFLGHAIEARLGARGAVSEVCLAG